MIYIIIIIFVLVYILSSQYIESFANYESKRLPYSTKEDVYMNFLDNLKDSFKNYITEENYRTNFSIPQRVLCDDDLRKKIQKNALLDAFKTVPQKEIDKDSSLFDKNKGLLYATSDNCGDKATYLCELTNPMLYMSQNPYFPPRWIGPYKKVQLPKHTDLKCWNNMRNCCKTNV